MALPGPLSPRSVPAHQSSRAAFDSLVSEVIHALEGRFAAEPEQVEIAVEEAPMLPTEWIGDVPFSTLNRGGASSRVVVFRLPLSARCETRSDLADLVWSVLLTRLGEVWQVSPDDLDPRTR